MTVTRIVAFLLVVVVSTVTRADSVSPTSLLADVSAPTVTVTTSSDPFVTDATLAVAPALDAESSLTTEPQLSSVGMLNPPAVPLTQPRQTFNEVSPYEGGAPLQGYLPSDVAAAPVPLPPAAWAGLSLIAAVTVSKIRRRHAQLA